MSLARSFEAFEGVLPSASANDAAPPSTDESSAAPVRRGRGRPPSAKRFPRDRLIEGLTRDEIALKYTQKVNFIARRVMRRLPRHAPVELGDLVNTGFEGLLDSLDKYDPDRNTSFSTFVEFRVNGAILDLLRSLDMVSRNIREKNTAIERARATLQNDLGRAAEPQELATALGLSIPEYERLRGQVLPVNLISLDNPRRGSANDSLSLSEVVPDQTNQTPAEALASKEALQLMQQTMMERLPERERAVLEAYYLQRSTLKEIGSALNVTESRVSQIHTQALMRLRSLLAKDLRPEQSYEAVMARRGARRGRRRAAVAA